MAAGYGARRSRTSKKDFPAWYTVRRQSFIRRGKAAMAQRANVNIEQVGLGAFRGGRRMHADRRDGAAMVEDDKRMADLIGRGFIFIADHRTVHQRKECRKFSCW